MNLPAAGSPLRITLVNPPFRRPVMRRFVASYFAPNFLLPPTDLLYMSAAAKQYLDAQTKIVDAIAKKLDEEATIAAVRESQPHLLFVQLGFATIEDDLCFCDRLREDAGVPLVAMGYLPTMFAEEVMNASQVDALVRGEPEHAFCDLVRAWREGGDPATIPGVVVRRENKIVIGPEPERIVDLDELPLPDHRAVDPHDYSEALIGSPIGAIFTARGCPFPCTFCVRTFGPKLALRSAASVLREARLLVREMGVRNLRFMDDTFNFSPERTAEICRGLLELQPLQWTALARLDRLDEQTVALMARSGCRRLYVGVESGSQRMLELYQKGSTLAQMRRGIELIRRAGMEVSAFFIVGGPTETRADFEASLSFAKETKLDYVIVTRMQYWPGTKLFAEHKNELETSIVPFYCRPRDVVAYDRLLELEREFYRRFYLRPYIVWRHVRWLVKHPGDLAASFLSLLRYLFGKTKEDFI
ncbi:MAG TPA: radical SAM protein [bacterium]|nr:radical SAM protein [bacterium]